MGANSHTCQFCLDQACNCLKPVRDCRGCGDCKRQYGCKECGQIRCDHTTVTESDLEFEPERKGGKFGNSLFDKL